MASYVFKGPKDAQDYTEAIVTGYYSDGTPKSTGIGGTVELTKAQFEDLSRSMNLVEVEVTKSHSSSNS